MSAAKYTYGYNRVVDNLRIWHADPQMFPPMNVGTSPNGPQFFLITAKTIWLDENAVAFAGVVKGIKKVENFRSPTWKNAVISDCGQLCDGLRSRTLRLNAA